MKEMKFISKGLAKAVLEDNVGSIHPISFNGWQSKGAALMNPSIYNDNGQLRCVIRCTNYTLHHSEKSMYPHWAGPLQYIHPEDDVRLATENFVVDLNEYLDITKVRFVNMKLNTNSVWGFHGLEDARLVRWNDKLFLTGVRRDTKENGEGRMELSEIQLKDKEAVEVSRVRIPSTGNDDSYCEKNWMPILGLKIPFTYMKWTSPTEIVRFNYENKELNVIKSDNDNRVDTKFEIRGGSHVIPYKDYYIAFGHSVTLWKPYAGEKDSDYLCHCMVWDKHFNLLAVTDGFKINGSKIEFTCGLAQHDDGDFILSYADEDNAPYLLKFNPDWLLDQIL